VPTGVHTVVATAVDQMGNASRWERRVTVRDLPTRTFELRLLGGLGGGDSGALDLNQSGEAVGWALRPGGDTAAVLWRGGEAIDLSEGLGRWSKAAAIANSGEVVGKFGAESNCPRSFRWKDGTRDFLEECGFWAEDVNDHGSVLFRGGKLLRDGALIDLAASSARPIHPRVTFRLAGDDAVLALYFPLGGGCGGGYCSYGPMILRPPYSPGTVTLRQGGGVGFDLNDHGDVTSTCGGGSGQGNCAGVIYPSGGVRVVIAWPTPGRPVLYSTLGGAYAINNLRQAVGIASQADGTAPFAYLWETGTVYRVVASVTDWTIDDVGEINDRGQVVGHARNVRTGEKGAVLLTPAT
jgi:uncharacterized membrane protein